MTGSPPAGVAAAPRRGRRIQLSLLGLAIVSLVVGLGLLLSFPIDI